MAHSIWLIQYGSFNMAHSIWLIQYGSFDMAHSIWLIPIGDRLIRTWRMTCSSYRWWGEEARMLCIPIKWYASFLVFFLPHMPNQCNCDWTCKCLAWLPLLLEGDKVICLISLSHIPSLRWYVWYGCIGMCDMAHLYLGRDAFIRVTWLITICEITCCPRQPQKCEVVLKNKIWQDLEICWSCRYTRISNRVVQMISL